MPDQSAMMQVPPGVDPIEYAKVLRQSQVADLLQQAALSPVGVQQPQGSNRGFYQAAKVSPLSGLSRLAEAMMAKKAMDSSNINQAQIYARGLQAFSPNGPPPAPAAQGQEGGYSGGAGASDAGQPASAQPVNPLNPLRQDPRALMRLYMTDPAKYLDQIKGTPEWQTALAAHGGNVTAAQAAIKAELTKKGTLELRAGGEAGIPDAGSPEGYRFIRTPNLSPNQDYTRNAEGAVAETHLIPGALDAQGALKGRETAETHANTPIEVDMGGGVKALRYPGDVAGVGLAPSMRGPQAPATPTLPSLGPHQQYFPQAPAGPAGPQPLPQKASDGTTFDHNLWPGIPKMQIPSSPGQSTNAYQQEIVKSAAVKHQALVDEYGKQSAAGVQQLEYLTAAEKALPKAEVGPMSEWLTHNRGVLVQQFPSLAGALGGEKVTPTLELNKQLTNAALQGARSTFGTRMTQNEVKLQTEEMSPSVAMTRDALNSLIHQAKMKAAYAIQQDKDYSEYHAANGDPNRFESQYNVRRPITRFAAQYDTPPAAMERLKHKPDLLPDFKAKFGWDPTQ